MIDDALLSKMHDVFTKFTCIKKVILFGSRAKGTHRENSDIDIAIVGCTDFLFCEKIADCLSVLPTLLRFDVVNYDEIKNIQLKEHIDRVGVVLYERDKNNLLL